jgi:hypothetical protein
MTEKNVLLKPITINVREPQLAKGDRVEARSVGRAGLA